MARHTNRLALAMKESGVTCYGLGKAIGIYEGSIRYWHDQPQRRLQRMPLGIALRIVNELQPRLRLPDLMAQE